MGLCRWLVIIFMSVWLAALVFTLYGITNPEPCYPITSSTSECIKPLFPRSSQVHLRFFVGTSLNTASVVWDMDNFTIGSSFEKTVVVPIPDSVRRDGDLLIGWLVMMTPAGFRRRIAEVEETSRNKKKKTTKKFGVDLDDVQVVIQLDLTVNRKLSARSEVFLLSSQASQAKIQKSPLVSEDSGSSSALHPHWKYSHQPLTVRVIEFNDVWLHTPMLPHLIHRLEVHSTTSGRHYAPIVFVDDVTLRSSQLVPMSRNLSQPHPKLTLNLIHTHPVYFGVKKWEQEMIRIMSEMVTEGEVDELKRSFSDDYIYRYLLSQAIAFVHIYLEYAAFSHDLAFFVHRKSFIGLSGSALFMAVFRSAVMFLYLYDAGTSTLVLFSFFKDFLYNLWKLTRLLRLNVWGLDSVLSVVGRIARGLGLMPRALEDVTGQSLVPSQTAQTTQTPSKRPAASDDDGSGVERNNSLDGKVGNDESSYASESNSNTNINSNSNSNNSSSVTVTPTVTVTSGEDPREKLTQEYDRVAIVHVFLCTLPLALGTTLYSLVYFTYTSWWSWFISSLADSVYYFGFVAMTPQLYINYKLKSVAHLPLKAFVYKMFSTFIDDAFAFLVKMPWKHRVMTLRDDVIFLGFLYQWYIYPVDKTRPNEFGYQFEPAGSPAEPGASAEGSNSSMGQDGSEGPATSPDVNKSEVLAEEEEAEEDDAEVENKVDGGEVDDGVVGGAEVDGGVVGGDGHCHEKGGAYRDIE